MRSIGSFGKKHTRDKGLLRASTTFALSKTVRFLGHQIGLFARRRWHRFRYTCVNVGAPIPITESLASAGPLFGPGDGPERFEQIETLGRHLMDAVGAFIPVTPDTLVSDVLLAKGYQPVS